MLVRLLRVRRIVLLPLVVAVVATAACGPAYRDPETRAFAAARDAVLRIGELQSTVIAASEKGAIPAPTAVAVVKFTTFAIRTVQQTPYGWGPGVAAAWTEVKVRYGSEAVVASYVAAIDALLAQVLSGGPQ